MCPIDKAIEDRIKMLLILEENGRGHGKRDLGFHRPNVRVGKVVDVKENALVLVVRADAVERAAAAQILEQGRLLRDHARSQVHAARLHDGALVARPKVCALTPEVSRRNGALKNCPPV